MGEVEVQIPHQQQEQKPFKKVLWFFRNEIPFEGGQVGIFLQHPLHPCGTLGYVGCEAPAPQGQPCWCHTLC